MLRLAAERSAVRLALRRDQRTGALREQAARDALPEFVRIGGIAHVLGAQLVAVMHRTDEPRERDAPTLRNRLV